MLKISTTPAQFRYNLLAQFRYNPLAQIRYNHPI